MQDVKIIIFLNLLFFSIYLCDAQEIYGKYQLIDASISSMEIGVTYNFQPNGVFENISHEHLGEKIISGGNYTVNKDTLILTYKNLKSNSNCSKNIIEKERIDSSNILFADLQVFDSKGKPQIGVHLLLKTKDKNIILGFSSDSEGKFPPLYIYDPYIQFLDLSFVGYNDVSINTDTLFGFDTEFKINLNNSSETYSDHEGTYKFIIKNLDSKGIELVSFPGKKVIKFKKID